MYTTVSTIIQECGHAVQFYDQDSFLIEKLQRFIDEGLALGESVIIIATPLRREALAESLNRTRESNEYWEFDAADTLAKFMDNGHIDRVKFHAVIGELLRKVSKAGNGRIRVFGEMVALLWEQGQLDNALLLENAWNELAVHHSFSLLCAYPIRGFSSHQHSRDFQKICHTHSAIGPAESAVDPESLNGADSAVTLAMLQQKTVALEGEVARRQEIERALRQRDEELADFLENAVECVHQVGPDGTILWANKAELAMLGYEAHEYIGRHISEFHVDQPIIEDILQRLLHGETLHDFPARLRCKDGSVKDVLILSNVRWENGTFKYTRCFTRDISKRKRFEQELEQCVKARTSELEESQQKLRVLAAELSLAESRVRKTLATELHDYLAQLLIVTRLKLGQATREAKEHSKILQILTETDEVLNESILYTRTLMAELNPPILEFGLPMGLRWLAEKKFRKYQLAVEVEVQDGFDLHLPEDKTCFLFQSVRELLMNVIKHAEADRARISLRLSDHVLYLEVADQGKGFDPAVLRRHWSARQDLVQFGLFSLRERMEALGGRVEVSSAPNQGTSVILTLPVGLEPHAISSPEQTAHAVAPFSLAKTPGLVRVLLVEDHAVVREGLRGVLEGYPDIQVVGEAANGEEAITQAESCRPDVIVMDINLPILNGIDATRHIKRCLPDAVVIGLSFHQANHVEPALIEAGGSLYLTKESAAASLYEAIQTAVRTSSSHPPVTAG